MVFIKQKTKVFLFLILALATFLRFYQIDTNPKALYGDSLTLVYDAYSILKTGHDQKGEFLPLVFSLGGGRPAGYVYVTVPLVAVFGPTALAARMVSVLSGIGIVLLLYFLGKNFFSRGVGLAIAAVASLNPWELSLSREAYETHFALFLTLLGFFSFIKGFKKPIWFILFGVAFALSSQTYPIYRLMIPVFTIWLLIWSKQFNPQAYLKKPLFLTALILIFASTLLGVYQTVSRGSQDRFGNINIFQDAALKLSISQKVGDDRSFDSLSTSVSRLFHNSPVELGGVLAENYLDNIFPNFLFLHGDGQPRHNPAGVGELFWVDILFIVIGIIYLYKFNRRLLILLVGWILIAPIPTSLVGEAHALRSSFLLPPLLILTGVGLWKLWSERRKLFYKGVLVFAGVVLVVQLVLFLDKFYFVAPKKFANFWSYPAREAATLASRNRQKFNYVVLSNDIDNMEFAYPVYNKLDPSLVIQQNQSPTKLDGLSFFRYENVYIGSMPHGMIKQFIKDLPGSVLYIGSNKEQPDLEGYSLITGFDGNTDLVIVAKQGTPDLSLP